MSPKTAALLEQMVAALRQCPGRGRRAAASNPPASHSPQADPASPRPSHSAPRSPASLFMPPMPSPPTDRAALERLCRYGLRAPFSQQRLAWRRRRSGPLPPAPALAYRSGCYPTGARSSSTFSVDSPPWSRHRTSHLVRYHGLFANRSRWRSRLPRPPLVGDDSQPEASTAAAKLAPRPTDPESDGGTPRPSRPPNRRARRQWRDSPLDPPPPSASCAISPADALLGAVAAPGLLRRRAALSQVLHPDGRASP